MLSMTAGLSHDENQHISAGALLAREGLLPYRDFPHFHTPYLAFIYGLLFRFTDHLLLAARLFTMVCATAAVGLVGASAAQAFRAHRPWPARLAVAGALILVLSAQVFTHTTGHAWNHEPALLGALAAFLLHLSGVKRGSVGRLCGSGLLLGLTIGLRLTYAPLLAPFGLAVLLLGRETIGRRLVLAAWFSAGALLALGGVAWLAVLAPEQAWFGNFEFARVNVAYRMSTFDPRTMTLPTKARYLFKSIAVPDLGLVIAFLLPFVAAVHLRRTTRRSLPQELLLVLWCLPFLLLGSLAPSPLFAQYFYPFVFFFALGGAYAFASLPLEARGLRPAAFLAGVGVLFSLGRGAKGYREVSDLLKPSHWTPLELHAEAASLHAVPETGRILTLEPLTVLEAGRRIYPEFATGPFAWRIGAYVEPAKAARLKIPAPATFDALLAAEPPAALILGAEEKGEALLKSYVEQHGYRLLPTRGSEELWVRP
jgi:4-amino-4-deoxy-L-arabinose transferase-like glycosyltransferase